MQWIPMAGTYHLNWSLCRSKAAVLLVVGNIGNNKREKDLISNFTISFRNIFFLRGKYLSRWTLLVCLYTHFFKDIFVIEGQLRFGQLVACSKILSILMEYPSILYQPKMNSTIFSVTNFILFWWEQILVFFSLQTLVNFPLLSGNLLLQ